MVLASSRYNSRGGGGGGGTREKKEKRKERGGGGEEREREKKETNKNSPVGNRRFPEITGKDNLTVFSYSERVKSPEWRRQLRRADLRQF